MVAYNFAKVNARVRFSLPAPKQERSSNDICLDLPKKQRRIYFANEY